MKLHFDPRVAFSTASFGGLVKPSGAEHGKLSFVDLAGSERGADVGDVGKQTRLPSTFAERQLKTCVRRVSSLARSKNLKGLRGLTDCGEGRPTRT